jgi:hypothetical protein
MHLILTLIPNSLGRKIAGNLGGKIEGIPSDYDHDKDYSIQSLSSPNGQTNGHTNGHSNSPSNSYSNSHHRSPSRSYSERDSYSNRDDSATHRDMDGDSDDDRHTMGQGWGGLQGPVLCVWLDKELSVLRGEYEGEIRILESIIADLRMKKGKRKKGEKRGKKALPSVTKEAQFSQEGLFVVRHLDNARGSGSLSPRLSLT